MEKDNSEDTMNDSSDYKDSEGDTSFVTKVRSRVSGLFNSSISRLFGSQEKRNSTVRRRENDDDNHESQPPCKKAKVPENNTSINSYFKDNHATNNIHGTNSLSNASITNFTNFAEPVAGPSGIRTLRSFNKTLTSSTLSRTELSSVEKNSDSGESTSGYSSMPKMCNTDTLRHSDSVKNSSVYNRNKLEHEKSASENRTIGNKRLFHSSSPETPNRSLFADSSLSPQMKNTSLSSRRPSFNSSNFGSPNFVDRTITTKRIINSPFYNGPTIYGGASAYGRQPSLNESRREQLKNSFLVKPVNKSSENNPCTSLSKTARRILETLEQYSTPLSDAKKIPLPTKVEKQGLLSNYIGANPYRMRQSKVASNKELLVPTVPELLRMKEKQRLQDTTDKIRQIATSSKSLLNTEDYKIGEDIQQKHKNKIKTKISSVRSKAPPVEILDNVVLKPVPLTIPDNKLPKFDLVIPPPDCLKKTSQKEEIKTCMENKTSSTEATSTLSKTKETKVDEGCRKDLITEYTFSKPVVIADDVKSIIAINNFKFSEPLSKKICMSDSNSAVPVTVKDSKENKINNGDNHSGNVAQSLVDSFKNKNDSIMEKFKPPEGSWECTTCLIRNKAESVKCAACETTRAKETPKVEKSFPSFSIQFNKKPDEWDCTVCMVRNKVQNEKCVACSCPKLPSNAPKTNGFGNKFLMSSDVWECKTCYVRNKKDVIKCVACETARQDVPKSSGFGDKFKPPPGTWECQTCSIRNKAATDTCEACNTKRINNVINENKFGAQFKPPSDTWECETCLIRNKNDLKTCAACQTPKDKIFASVKSNALKMSSGKWECPTCMVRNDDKVEKCPCCETVKPGVTLVSKSTVNMFNFGVNKSQFNFGIPKEIVESTQPSTTTATPVVSVSTSSEASKIVTTAAPVFTFGIKPDTTVKETKNVEKREEKTPPTPIAPSASKTDDKKQTVSPLFQFGNPSSATKVTTTSSMSNFQFKSPVNVSKAPSTVSEQNKVGFGISSPVKFTFGNPATSTTSSSSTTTPVFKFDSTKPLLPPAGSGDSAGNSNAAATTTQLPISKSEPVNMPSFASTSKPEASQFTSGNNKAALTFSFGQTDNPPTAVPASSKPLFNFGTSAPVTGGFSFAAAAPKTDLSAVQAKPSNTFSFNPPKTEANLFAAPNAPSGGTTTIKNGGFNFGSAAVNSNQGAVFTFGAKQNLPQANQIQASSGGYNLAAPAVPTGPTGGFNFSVQAPAAVTPTFDANAKPFYNFTKGVAPPFAATPAEGGGAAPVRKFKKAVRRAAQR
ncbi:hypothetical protein HHI36_020161 [Cryptolaemus montrouzieri]|uniref:Nuclear pore complex protein Nup153 n=1 Tax=Cryptolaemus montrouzieri TaxID=559131 RepID=A0ABD2NA69_9CUCU